MPGSLGDRARRAGAELMHTLRASPLFAVVVLVTLALVGFIGVVLVQPNLIAGFLWQEQPAISAATSGTLTTAFTTSRSGSSSGRP
jgi:hypothetical protein